MVHVGEVTLDKRVSEFTTTDEAALTATEFKEHSKKEEEEEALRLQALEPLAALPAPDGPITHGCQHISEMPYAPFYADRPSLRHAAFHLTIVGTTSGGSNTLLDLIIVPRSIALLPSPQKHML